MRWVLIVAAVALAVLAYFFGLRLGYLGLSPAWMYNAQGINTYKYRTYDNNGVVIIKGSCQTSGGTATFRLFSPSGRYLGGQTCPKGEYGLALEGRGEVGEYQLAVEFAHFTGRLEVTEERAGGTF